MTAATDSVLLSDWQVVDDRQLLLGEGARFFGTRSPRANEPFVLVNLLDGELYSTSGEPGAGLNQVANFNRPLGAVAPLQDQPGEWLAALGVGLSHLAERDGQLVEVESWDQPAADREGPRMRVNDALADPTGRFWSGAMSYDADEGVGILFRRETDGEVQIVTDNITIPNGPAFTEDGTRMYFSDSSSQQLIAYDLDPATGGLSSPRVVTEVENGIPDGMVVDAEGCIWQTVFGDSALLRLSPDGDLLERMDLPVQRPTSVALSPTPPFRVVVTSAHLWMDDPGEMDGCVITADIRTQGVEAYSAR